MRKEYRFDYSNARPNRFCGRGVDDRVVVVPDRRLDDVNGILRALIDKMPRRVKRG